MESLRSIREKRGLKRNFVADNLGICPDHLNFIERGGTQAKEKYIEKLAEIYNLPLDEMKMISLATYERRE